MNPSLHKISWNIGSQLFLKHQGSNSIVMVIINCLLILVISTTLSITHYTPLYPFQPIWVYRPVLAGHLVKGEYQYVHHPNDGLDTVLAAYNISENAIKIIRDSVDVLEISYEDVDDLSFTRSPGVEVARLPRKVCVSSTAGEIVDFKNPFTEEDSKFSWRIVSPVSLVTKVVGKTSGLVELVTWTFNIFGAQVMGNNRGAQNVKKFEL